MNSIRLTVGILFVLFAARISRPAMAMDVEQPVRICQTDAPELNATAPVGEATAPGAAECQSTAPSSAKSRDDGTGGGCLPFCCTPCPCFYGQVEALFMKQDPQFTRQPIVVDYFTNKTYLSTSDLDFNFDPALRATVGMRLCGCRALEFSYFGLFQGNASASTGTPAPGAFLIVTTMGLKPSPSGETFRFFSYVSQF